MSPQYGELIIRGLLKMRHAVAFEMDRKPSSHGYRNYYSVDGRDVDLDAMVLLGFARFIERDPQLGGGSYRVTEAGCDALGMPAFAKRKALGK